MTAISRAYESRCDMLRQIFGGGDSPKNPKVSSRTMTASLFDALWR